MLFFWSIDWSDQLERTLLSFKNFCGSRSRVNKSLCCGSLFLFVLYLMGQQCWHLTEGAEAIKVHSNISPWTATVFLLFFLLNAKCHLSFILIFLPFSPSRNESIHHNIIKRWLQGELRLLEQWSLSRQIAILQFFLSCYNLFSFQFVPTTSWNWAWLKWTQQTGSLLIVQSHNLTPGLWLVTFLLLREGSLTPSACLCKEYLPLKVWASLSRWRQIINEHDTDSSAKRLCSDLLCIILVNRNSKFFVNI